MSISLGISSLEKDIKDGNLDIDNKISKLRNLILYEDKHQLKAKEAKFFAIRIWDISQKLQKMNQASNVSKRSGPQLSIISQLKVLSTDVYQEYMSQNDENDLFMLFYFYSYTYKSLIDAKNISLADQYISMALRIYPKLNHLPKVMHILVYLKIWEVQFLISKNNDYNEALSSIKDFIDHNTVDLSLLLPFIYKKTLECQSIEWCNYCLSLAYNSPTISYEWKNQIESLLGQLYLNNGQPDKAMKHVLLLPKSINKLFLELKCLILLSPNEKSLKQKLFSFISETSEDRRVLITLCLFIADNCDQIKQESIEFITKVIKISHTIHDTTLRKQIYLSAMRISCKQNDINSASLFLKIINSHIDPNTNSNFTTNISNQIADEDKREIAEMLWNEAFNMLDISELEKAVQWMKLSNNIMSDNDDQAQSICHRFISYCLLESKKYEEALISANLAIKRNPNGFHAYLLKYQILVAIGSENEAFDFISGIINGSFHIKSFEPEFFTSIAAELHSKGNNILALDSLLKLYELSVNLNSSFSKNISKSVINSIFSLLQMIEDPIYVFKAISIISSHWKDKVQNDLILDLSSDDIQSYSAVVYSNGLELKTKNLFEIAAKLFMCGSLIIDFRIDLKLRFLFEATDCFIRFATEDNKSESAMDSALESAQEVLSEISLLIENVQNTDKMKTEDELSLAKIKLELAKKHQSAQKEQSISSHVIELINSISSHSALAEASSLLGQFGAPSEVILVLLQRAKKIDHESIDGGKSEACLSASLLYRFLMNSTNVEEIGQLYEMVLDVVGSEIRSLMSSSQLQFFMSHAWNIGVRFSDSYQLKEAELWFKKAIKIMEIDEELKLCYSSEINSYYSIFLDATHSL